MSTIKVELITDRGTEDYYFVDPAAAVAFANFRDEHATVINHHGQVVHVSTATEAAPVAEAAVEEVTMDSVAEVTVDADPDAPVKKSRKKKE